MKRVMMKIKAVVGLPLRLAFSLIRLLVIYMPGPTGHGLRYHYYKRRLRHLGKDVTIGEGVLMFNPEFISIGDNAWIDKYCILMAGKPHIGQRIVYTKELPEFTYRTGEIAIGDNCHIAPNCIIQAHGGVQIGRDVAIGGGTKFYSFVNNYRDPKHPSNKDIFYTPRAQENQTCYTLAPIVIGDNVGISVNCLILEGTIIERDSYITPFSQVRGRIQSNTVAGGVPAKRIKERFSDGTTDTTG
ncbi:MAG: acyltransferase [Dehalococcoidia bacterium]|nr:acyltransferase [Dehalococcoidia bacterium]